MLLPAVSLTWLFKTGQSPRDKFLSRLFGVFSEEIVRIWCSCQQAHYEDIGRPTVRLRGGPRGKTLDFTFRRRCDGQLFVGEMKCELEFENYRYLTLTDPSQLEHHRGSGDDAFSLFLQLAKEPGACKVSVKGREVSITGAILVWGAVSKGGRQKVAEAEGLADILSLEDLIGDLLLWNPPAYQKFVVERAKWCEELFNALAGKGQPIKETSP